MANPTRSLQVFLVTIVLARVQAKIYSHCELARELLDVHEIPLGQLATWVCIAEHEANMNTAAKNAGSGDHGLFQISELFWCSPPGYACGVSCADLRNDDIEDDVVCARRIYREHKRLSGDGFNAWVVYTLFCNGDVSRYIEGCFNESTSKLGGETLPTTQQTLPSSSPIPLSERLNTKIISSTVPSSPMVTTITTASQKPPTIELKTTTTIKHVTTTTAATTKVTQLTSTERREGKESVTKASTS